MNPDLRTAAERLRRVYAGEYLLDIYPQRRGMLQEEALERAVRDRSADERTLARAWLDEQDAVPTAIKG